MGYNIKVPEKVIQQIKADPTLQRKFGGWITSAGTAHIPTGKRFKSERVEFKKYLKERGVKVSKPKREPSRLREEGLIRKTKVVTPTEQKAIEAAARAPTTTTREMQLKTFVAPKAVPVEEIPPEVRERPIFTGVEQPVSPWIPTAPERAEQIIPREGYILTPTLGIVSPITGRQMTREEALRSPVGLMTPAIGEYKETPIPEPKPAPEEKGIIGRYKKFERAVAEKTTMKVFPEIPKESFRPIGSIAGPTIPPGEFERGVRYGLYKDIREKPVTTAITTGVGYGAAKVFKYTGLAKPFKELPTKGKLIVGGLGATYVGAKGIEVATAKDTFARGQIIGETTVELGAFTVGYGLGARPKIAPIKPKVEPVTGRFRTAPKPTIKPGAPAKEVPKEFVAGRYKEPRKAPGGKISVVDTTTGKRVTLTKQEYIRTTDPAFIQKPQPRFFMGKKGQARLTIFGERRISKFKEQPIGVMTRELYPVTKRPPTSIIGIKPTVKPPKIIDTKPSPIVPIRPTPPAPRPPSPVVPIRPRPPSPIRPTPPAPRPPSPVVPIRPRPPSPIRPTPPAPRPPSAIEPIKPKDIIPSPRRKPPTLKKTPSIKPSAETPWVWPGGLGLPFKPTGGGGYRGVWPGFKRIGVRRTKYTPSLVARTFGIYGKVPTGKLTGLELRPLRGKPPKELKKKISKGFFDINI